MAPSATKLLPAEALDVRHRSAVEAAALFLESRRSTGTSADALHRGDGKGRPFLETTDPSRTDAPRRGPLDGTPRPVRFFHQVAAGVAYRRVRGVPQAGALRLRRRALGARADLGAGVPSQVPFCPTPGACPASSRRAGGATRSTHRYSRRHAPTSRRASPSAASLLGGRGVSIERHRRGVQRRSSTESEASPSIEAEGSEFGAATAWTLMVAARRRASL